jgi:hypothetical protein
MFNARSGAENFHCNSRGVPESIRRRLGNILRGCEKCTRLCLLVRGIGLSALRLRNMKGNTSDQKNTRRSANVSKGPSWHAWICRLHRYR